MFVATVYDDGRKNNPIEVFEGEELDVVYKATKLVRCLRSSAAKVALGRFTFRLAKKES